MASKLGGQKELDEYCSPEIQCPSEAVEGSFVVRRPSQCGGKADALSEVTAKCTVEATGAWVLASKESIAYGGIWVSPLKPRATREDTDSD